MEHITSPRDAARHRIAVRYWAGAADAAGTQEEELVVVPVTAASCAGSGGDPEARQITGADVRRAVIAAHPGIDGVLRRCTLLSSARRVRDSDAVAAGASVEVLPPFVGG